MQSRECCDENVIVTWSERVPERVHFDHIASELVSGKRLKNQVKYKIFTTSQNTSGDLQNRWPRSTHSLWAVHTETPNFLASILKGSFPSSRCLFRAVISFRVSLRKVGRPKILPSDRAFAKPTLTRWGRRSQTGASVSRRTSRHSFLSGTRFPSSASP